MNLRHKNGGGKVDSVSEAHNSFINRQSLVQNQASVWDSRIVNSRISNSLITNATIEFSTIENSVITGGTISGSSICAELVTGNAVIRNSIVKNGTARIAENTVIENCSFENLTVKGNAQLLNWSSHFDGREGYLSEGIWERPPKILVIGEGEKTLTITEGIKGKAYGGCYLFEISKWLKIGERYGNKLGLTKDEIDLIRQFLLEL